MDDVKSGSPIGVKIPDGHYFAWSCIRMAHFFKPGPTPHLINPKGGEEEGIRKGDFIGNPPLLDISQLIAETE